MTAPHWARTLLARLAEPHRVDEVVGDLEEAHRRNLTRRGRLGATIRTGFEAIDMAVALLRLRRRSRSASSPTPQGPRGTPLPRRIPIISWLDLKLGARMLVKHPGLSLVSTLGMAVAVGIGTFAFGVIRGMTSSPLPLDEGDRVVTIQNVGAFGFEQARSTHLHDLQIWREEVQDIVATRSEH